MIQEICVIDDNGADVIVDIRKAFMEKNEKNLPLFLKPLWTTYHYPKHNHTNACSKNNNSK